MTLARIKNVATLHAGGTPSVEDPTMWQEDGLPWITIGDMTRSSVVNDSARRISEAGLADRRLLIGNPGTTLFAMYASVGAVAVLGVSAAWNQAILGIRTRPEAADDRYLRYWLQYLRPHLSALTRSNTQDNLNAEQVGNLPFPVVTVATQRAIADFLDTETARIDALIAKKRRLIELLNLRPVLDSEERLSSVRATAPAWPLKFLVRESDERLGDQAPPVLLSVSIHSGVVPREEMTDKLPRADDLASYKTCQVDDVVINRMRAFQGGVGVSRQVGVVSPDYTVLKVGPHLRPAFLHHLARSPWFVGEMTARLRGIGSADQGNVRTPRVNFADLGSIRVPVPSLMEQDVLIRVLEASVAKCRTTGERLDRQIDLLVEHRQALIAAAVTGELAVPGAPG